jgi:hypothetical protein
VLAALRGGHFKQPDYEVGKFMHFVKLGGGPAKVVTVEDALLDAHIIVGIFLLHGDRS